MMYYTGIGSRSTPHEVQTEMINIAFQLAKKGYILRSGGADGADTAFEQGCIKADGGNEIFIPYKGFRGSKSGFYTSKNSIERQAIAFNIAKAIHPAWSRCSPIAKAFHTRNVFQVLGWDLKTPSDFVICWTPEGKIKGGTATAINLALQKGIKVINLATEEFVYP